MASPVPPGGDGRGAPPGSPPVSRALGVALAVGALAHGGQILVFREAYGLGFPGEVGLTLLMLCWLLGSSLGALATRSLPTPLARPGLWGAVLVGSTWLALLALRWLYAVGLEASRITPGLGVLLGIGLAVTLLPSGAAGAALTLLLRRVPPASRSRVFAADCLGACGVGFALSLGWVSGVGLLPRSLRSSLWEKALPGARLVLERDLPDGRLAVLERAGMVVAYGNGQLAGWVPATEDERGPVLTALSLAPEPRRVLVLDASLGAFLASAVEEGATSVLGLVRDRRALEALARAAPELATACADPRVEILEADPRVALRTLPAGSRDLLLLPEAHPGSAAANRLFTREAFRDMRRVLSPEGVLLLPLPTHPAGQVSPGAVAGRSAWLALAAAFPEGVAGFGSSPMIAVASPSRPSLDASDLVRRFPGSSLGPDLVYHLEQVLDPGEAEAGRRALDSVVARENRDHRPWASGAALEARLREHTTASEAGILVLAGMLLGSLALALVLRRLGAGPTLGALGSGTGAMLAWGGCLYLFQLARGALYQEIGMVGAVCLLGLALGAVLPRHLPSGASLLLAAGGLLAAGRLPPGVPVAVLSLVCGALGSYGAGQVMAELLERHGEHPGALEAGDLLGAAGGSLLVSLGVFTGPGPDLAALGLGILGLGFLVASRRPGVSRHS